MHNLFELAPIARLARLGSAPVITKSDTDGEVVFATASMVKRQVFNGPPPMNCAYPDFAISIKSAQEPNGMKLASARLVEQLLTQFLPGLDHEGEGLGSPFLDPRLHSMRSTGVDDQGF
jgi:hypothetical protein